MSADSTRRTFLRSATVGTVPVLSGCSGFFSESDSESSDPDAGRDSYGIVIQNETAETHTVQIKVALPFGDETAFEEAADVNGGESREWEQVVTESKEWAVTAKLKGADTLERFRSDTLWITPGSDGAPEIENVRVVVKRPNQVSGKPLMINVTDQGE